MAEVIQDPSTAREWWSELEGTIDDLGAALKAAAHRLPRTPELSSATGAFRRLRIIAEAGRLDRAAS